MLLGLKATYKRDWVVVGRLLSKCSKGFSQVGADFPVFCPSTHEEYA